MSRVRVSIHIAKPLREIYEFVAKPRLWRLWLIERVRLAGEETCIAWKVTSRDPSRRQVMRARTPRGEAALELTFAPNGKGTLCECEISYDSVGRLADWLVQPWIRREASRGLEALKRALE